MANNNNKDKCNVPHLRFPEFTGEWKMATFGDIAKGFDYGMNAAAKSFDGNNKYIRITDIDEVSSQYLYDDVVSPDGELEDRYLVKENDILLARTGASTGKSYLYRNSDGKLYFAGFLIRANIYKHNSYFVFSQLHTLRYKKWISVMSARSGQPGINSQEYASFPVYTTSLQEEDKIATFLKLLDERIITQNKIIEDLKKLKSAIVDRLYSSTNGETYSFCQLFEVVNEKNKKLDYRNVLSASQELGMIERSDINIDIKFEQESISGYKIVRKGDYVVHLRSFQGGFAFSDRTGICSPAYTILRPNDLVGYGYLSHFFTSKLFIKSLKLVTYGIRDGRSINVDEWLNMTVTLPNIQEQVRILTIINAIDAKLHIEIKKQSCLFRQKSYLLNTMFI